MPPTPTTPAGLSERYVHAVTHRLPDEQRTDVAEELRASIADRVESLRDERPDLDERAAEREALAELGDPAVLAGAYSGRRLQLLGPETYPAWERALTAILVVAVPTATAALAVVRAATGSPFGEVVGTAVWTALSVAVHVTFWTTLVFVLVERGSAPASVRADLGTRWDPDSLPDVPRRRGALGDLVATLSLLALFAGFLVWQQVDPPLTLDGRDVPVIDPDLWSSWIPVVLALLVVEAGFEAVRYLSGGWTRALARANVVLGALFAVPFVYLGLSERLFDPRAVELVQREWDGFDGGTAHLVVALVALGIWVWESVDGLVKASRTPA